MVGAQDFVVIVRRWRQHGARRLPGAWAPAATAADALVATTIADLVMSANPEDEARVLKRIELVKERSRGAGADSRPSAKSDDDHYRARSGATPSGGHGASQPDSRPACGKRSPVRSATPISRREASLACLAATGGPIVVQPCSCRRSRR